MATSMAGIISGFAHGQHRVVPPFPGDPSLTCNSRENNDNMFKGLEKLFVPRHGHDTPRTGSEASSRKYCPESNLPRQ